MISVTCCKIGAFASSLTVPTFSPNFSFSASSKFRSSSFCRIRVLMSAYADVAGKQRSRALHDVDVHDAGAQVQERHHLARSRLVVVLVAVLQRERIDVHNSRGTT